MACLSRFSRIIGLLFLVGALGACSAIKLGYNNASELGYWWLDRYLDIDDSQAARVREDLMRLHQWHRQQELPKLAALLEQMEGLAAGELAPAQVCSVVTDIRARLAALADRAEPAVVTLALSLTPEQLRHLEGRYAKNNRKYREEWIALSPLEQKDKRFKEIQKRAEFVYGDLGAAQRDLLRRQAEGSAFDAGRVLAERQRRQQDSLQILRQLAGRPIGLAEAGRLMHGLVQRALASPDAAARNYQDTLLQEACRGVAALHNSTTPAQRAHAVRRLHAYRLDVIDLAANGGGGGENRD
jgi:hypothetical protein